MVTAIETHFITKKSACIYVANFYKQLLMRIVTSYTLGGVQLTIYLLPLVKFFSKSETAGSSATI